jgi:hypothetical protein
LKWLFEVTKKFHRLTHEKNRISKSFENIKAGSLQAFMAGDAGQWSSSRYRLAQKKLELLPDKGIPDRVSGSA